MALERLQKIISRAGITSRRKAEELIVMGEVTVNGSVVTELGTKVDPNEDIIKVNGKIIAAGDDVDSIYVVLNKPPAVVSTLSDPEGRPTLMDYIREIKHRIVPAGRLDFNSEGLILLTNDGDLVQQLSLARQLPKKYSVKVKGHYSPKDLLPLTKGIFTAEGVMRFKSITIEERLPAKTWITFEVIEGSKLDLRELLNRRNMMVDRIVRTALGPLELGTMKPGDLRYISKREIENLKVALAAKDKAHVETRIISRFNAAARPERERQAPVNRGSESSPRRESYQPSDRSERRPSRPMRPKRDDQYQERGFRQDRRQTATPSYRDDSDRPSTRERSSRPFQKDSTRSSSTVVRKRSGVIVRRTSAN